MSSKKSELTNIGREIAACAICRRGKIGKAVPGEGNPSAKIVFIGEAPGREEAKIGRPFIGRAGKLLRSLIKEIGLSEKEVYITNPVKYLPKTGTPEKKDILHGATHLHKELAVISPKITVLLGSAAYQSIFGEKTAVTKLHGRLVGKDNRNYFITLHPSAAIRFMKFKKILEQDFKKLEKLWKKLK